MGVIVSAISTAYLIWKYGGGSGGESDYEGHFDDEDGFIDIIKAKALENLTDINDYRNRVNDESDRAMAEERYEDYGNLLKLHKDLDCSFNKRKEWFLSKIGKRVFPNQKLCECSECEIAIKEGVVVYDRTCALDLFNEENNSKLRMENLRYSEI